jgi:hypothetical protein
MKAIYCISEWAIMLVVVTMLLLITQRLSIITQHEQSAIGFTFGILNAVRAWCQYYLRK